MTSARGSPCKLGCSSAPFFDSGFENFRHTLRLGERWKQNGLLITIPHRVGDYRLNGSSLVAFS